jgi:Mg/Co/Ni transporter MgtE
MDNLKETNKDCLRALRAAIDTGYDSMIVGSANGVPIEQRRVVWDALDESEKAVIFASISALSGKAAWLEPIAEDRLKKEITPALATDDHHAIVKVTYNLPVEQCGPVWSAMTRDQQDRVMLAWRRTGMTNQNLGHL